MIALKDMEPTCATVVSTTLLDLSRAARSARTRWALIGGPALIVHGVPRHSPDAGALVPLRKLAGLAEELVGTFGWTPLEYDKNTGRFAKTHAPVVHYLDDLALRDLQEERQMIPLRSALGLFVELRAAQHLVEQAVVSGARSRAHCGFTVPVAPLGGVLLLRIRAGTAQDIGSVEQAVEHLPRAKLEEAIAWARKHDRAGADALRAVVEAVWKRRTPIRVAPTKRRLPLP